MAFNIGGALGSAPVGGEPAGSAGTPKEYDGAAATGPLGASPVAASLLAASANSFILAGTEAQDTAAFAAYGFAVNLAATEAPDTAAAAVEVVGYCYLFQNELPDTATFNLSNYNLALDATEAPDTAVFNTSISSTLSMAATETPDSYAQKAYILWLEPDQPDDPTIWVPKNDPAPYLTTVI